MSLSAEPDTKPRQHNIGPAFGHPCNRSRRYCNVENQVSERYYLFSNMREFQSGGIPTSRDRGLRP